MKRSVRALAIATIGAAMLATVGSPVTAAGGTSSLVEDGAYPDAARILAEKDLKLISGDGHITLADCATTATERIRLLHRPDYTRPELSSEVCFDVTATTGWLNVEIANVYNIKAGTRPLDATINSDGTTETIQVPANTWTPVGEGNSEGTTATLLKLQVGTGIAPITGTHTATGKLSAGDRHCTATLVHQRWVLTAAACFADTTGDPVVAEGIPSRAGSVTFPGHGTTALDWLSPRTGRDVLLARLATPITDITPVALATAVVPVGQAVTALGYGRTAGAWPGDQQQTVAVTFATTSATTLTASSGPLLCRGTAGGPVLVNGKIAAVLSQAGQSGCHFSSGTDSSLAAARTDDLATWFKAVTTTTADHTWTLADMPATGATGTAVSSVSDSVFTGTALPLAATAGTTWNTADASFSPNIALNGTTGSLATNTPAVSTADSFTVSAWVKPTAETGTVLSQDGVRNAAFSIGIDSGNKAWSFSMPTADDTISIHKSAGSAPGTAKAGQWAHVTATYNKATGVIKLYVDGVETGSERYTSAVTATGSFRVGAKKTGAAVGSFLPGQVALVQVWNRVVEPAQTQTAGSFYKRLATPTRFLDTRNGTGGINGAIARNAVVQLKVAGVNGIPASGVTAVAISMAAINPADKGHVKVWPDLTPRPNAKNMTYAAGVPTSGYMIVPVGSNGYINISPGNDSMVHTFPLPDTSVHLLADVSGYFTSDTTASGISSYKPVVPVRFADSRSGLGGFSGKTTGTPWNYKVTGAPTSAGAIPNGITAVVVNITTVDPAAEGFLSTWEQGQTQPPVSGQQFQPGSVVASMAVVPVNPVTGQFTLSSGQATHVLIDILGYFAPGTAGQKYHALASVGLVDSFDEGAPIAAGSGKNVTVPNGVSGSDNTLVIGLTVESASGAGYVNVYPSAANAPGASTLNFAHTPTTASPDVSNSAVAKTGTGNTVTVAVNGSSAYLSAFCNGYFANS